MSIESYVLGILREINSLDKRIRRIEARGTSSPMYAGKSRDIIISSGAFTVVTDYYILHPESGVADDLDNINFRDPNVPLGGKKVFLRSATGNTVTIKHNTGNIDLTGAGAADVALDHHAKSIILVFDFDYGKWIVYSSNA